MIKYHRMLRQLLDQYEASGHMVSMRPGGKEHLQLRVNGRLIVVSSTPRDAGHAVHHARKQIERILRASGQVSA